MIINYSKPLLIISDKEDINKILNKNKDIIIKLYDEYTLTTGEIAALFGQRYFEMNNYIKTLNLKTSIHSGRRNSSFGKKFTEERCKNISNSLKGKSNNSNYIRTIEIKNKISNTLKEGHKTGRIKVNRDAISKAWADGKYKNVKMGRGIQGFMYSIKNKKDIYFRSLLELKYFIELEENIDIIGYEVEPFQIKLPGNSHYTPDVLINNKILVELKPYGHEKYTGKERFELEVKNAKEYCKNNNLKYKIIYDKDINFESRKYKNYLKNNPNIIQQFNIRFNK